MGLVRSKHKYSKLPIKHTRQSDKNGMYSIDLDIEVPQYAQVSPALKSGRPTTSRNVGKVWTGDGAFDRGHPF